MARRTENTCPVPNGTLLVIGGKENKGEDEPENKATPDNFIRLEVLQTFRDLVKKKEPVLEVITTSSGESEESFKEYKELFTNLGFAEVRQTHHTARQELMEDPMIERVKEADAFFFTGGDQLKLTSIYGGTEWLTILKERYINDKIVIAGTSAGAMALSTPMIYAGNSKVQELAGEIRVTTGLEFLKDVLIDTHFVNRGRFVRMAQVIVTNPSCIGMGIEEDTAMIVRNGTDVEVVGTGTIIVVEGFDISEANIEDFASKRPVSIRNLKVHFLASGDTYTIQQVNPPHK